MILVDTSVWIAHFRSGQPRLAKLLEEGAVLTHEFVTGELACGNLRRRVEVLQYLDRLVPVPVASNAEARRLLEARKLMGHGLGWIDVHLLASCLLAKSRLWTLDKGLAHAATRLEVAA